MKTPEQIASEILSAENGGQAPHDTERRVLSALDLRLMLARAIEADRVQPERDGSVHAAVAAALRDREDETSIRAAAWVDAEPDEFWEAFGGQLLDDIERKHGGRACVTCGSTDEPEYGEAENLCYDCDRRADGEVECPTCGEWKEGPLNYEGTDNEMCDSCEHNARRSGWEGPGR